MTERYPLRQVTRDQFEEFYSVVQHAFRHGLPAAAERETTLARFEFDRSVGAFDGDSMVGTVGEYSFTMAVPGAVVPVSGESWLAVLPTHRRRGIGRALSLWGLDNAHEHGEVLKAGIMAQGSTHGRYGWAPAAAWTSFRIEGGKGLRRGLPEDPGLRIRITEPRRVRRSISEVYDTLLAKRPGFFIRNREWWDHVLRDPVYLRQGLGPLGCVLVDDESGARGYALHRGKLGWDDDGLPAGVIEVVELMATDAASCAALWESLLDRDLTAEVRAGQRPADDPLPYMLADTRQARTRVRDGLWLRIVDVRKALEKRHYSTPIDVVIDVADDILKHNQGRWRLQASAHAGDASCERTSDAADVFVTISGLAAAYLGGTRLTTLATAGLVSELRSGAVRALSAALSWDPAPWCPTSF